MSPLEHELRAAWSTYLAEEPASATLTLYSFMRWLALNRPQLLGSSHSRWAEARVRSFLTARAGQGSQTSAPALRGRPPRAL